ncbi:hypothetical protein [Spiroplasma endosymbiont of Lonchoptera lutea]|uniref:hypothetical protein n=1 Tax=Spiroplasma endosymbiont of Lonchoptera lutea TaxID=3066297 RepID=UPI0030D2918F
MKEKLQFKIRIKNWFKNHWLKILLSIVFIFINLILWTLTLLDTNWILGTNREFIDFIEKDMYKFFDLNTAIMLFGLFVYWFGSAIFIAFQVEKLVWLIVKKIKEKGALKNETKQTH